MQENDRGERPIGIGSLRKVKHLSSNNIKLDLLRENSTNDSSKHNIRGITFAHSTGDITSVVPATAAVHKLENPTIKYSSFL